MAVIADTVVTELQADVNGYIRDVTRAESAFDGFMAKAEADARKAGVAFENISGPANRAGEAIGKTGLNTANLAAQLNDIAVTLAAGQSPLQIALQQGTQINQVLGQSGAAGAVNALKGAFLSLLTPVSLATLAIIGLGGFAVQYATSLLGGVEEADDALKAHAKIISEIKDSYGVATEGMDDYSRQTKAVLEALARDSAATIRNSLSSELEDLFSNVGGLIGYRGNQEYIATSIFKPFQDAILRLRQGFVDGQPDVQAFRDEVARIANATQDTRIRELANELLEMTTEADKSSAALRETEAAIRALNGAVASSGISDFAKALGEYGTALDRLNKIGVSETERTTAARAYQEAITAARGDIELETQALAAYQQVLERVSAKEAERAAKEAERAARRGNRENPFERELRQLNERIRLAEVETETIGQSQFARDKALIAEQLTNAALQARIPINEQLIQQESTKGAAALQALRSAEEGAQALNDLMQTFGDHATDTFLGLIEGTKSWNDALQETFKLLSRMFAQAAFTGGGPLGTLLGLGGQGGNVGGLFGLFGKRAHGGSAQQGKPYLVGEQGPELMIPGRSGTVIPNHRLTQAVSGGASMGGPAITMVNDFRGNDASTRAYIDNRLRVLEAQIAMTPQTTSETWRRNRPALNTVGR